MKKELKEKLKPKTTKKKILLGVFVLLLGALGLEIGNTDFDLATLLQTGSFEESEIIRDADGNIDFSGLSPLVVSCEADTYNCSDFQTQAQATAIMNKCADTGKDVFGLDRDGDGEACETLPVE